MIAWTPVHAIIAVEPESDDPRAATRPAKNKIVWEHSSTRNKWRNRTRLNRGEDSPINYPLYPLCCARRGAHTRAHVAAWPACHLARPVRLLRGPPVCCHVTCVYVTLASHAGHTRPATWPQCHVVTSRWTRVPRQPQVISPPFSRF